MLHYINIKDNKNISYKLFCYYCGLLVTLCFCSQAENKEIKNRQTDKLRKFIYKKILLNNTEGYFYDHYF